MIRVLITCVGSGVGQSVVDSLKAFNEHYYVIGSDQNRYCYPVPDCNNFVSLPRLDEPDYIDALLEAVVGLNVDVVIPGHDLELARFAENRKRIRGAGADVIVSDVSLVRLLRDKLAWARYFRKHTDSVVASCLVEEWLKEAGSGGVTLPAIAKPPDGSASSGVVIVRNPQDLTGIPEQHVLQTFLFPAASDPEVHAVRSAVSRGKFVQLSEISVQLVFSKDGELIGRFASRNRLKSGVPIEIHPLDSDEIWTAVDRVLPVLEKFAPRGPVNLQGRLTDDGLVFFEMNPRFTGITGNRAQFGFNEVSLLVDNFVTGTKRPLLTNCNKIGVRQVACRTWPRERYAFMAGNDATCSKGILVVGATSWLGRHFVFSRQELGDDVIVVSRDASVERARCIYEGHRSVRVIGERSDSLKDAFAWAEVVVNFASARPPHGTSAISESHRYQVRMLEHSVVGEIAKIVNLSSQSVYGKSKDGLVVETSELDVREPYAFSHFAIEELVRSLSRQNPSITGVSLRLGRLFGPAHGLRDYEFPHMLIKNAVSGRSTDVNFQDSAMDWLDIRDAVNAINLMVDREDFRARGDIYNVGSSSVTRIGRLVELVDTVCRERTGRPARVNVADCRATEKLEMSCEKIADLGWRPQYSLEASVRDLFEFFLDEAK